MNAQQLIIAKLYGASGREIAGGAVAPGESVAAAMRLVADDKINNAKTIIGLQWLALNRADLRQRWS